MHYLNYLAEKLVLKLEAQERGSAVSVAADPELVKAMRAVLEAEVEGGRLHYDVIHSAIRSTSCGDDSLEKRDRGVCSKAASFA